MIFAAFAMAIVGEIWFLVVAWRESKLVFLIVAAPTVAVVLGQTGVLAVPATLLLLASLVALLIIIGFTIYNWEKTWLPVLMVIGGNIWFRQQGGAAEFERKVEELQAMQRAKRMERVLVRNDAARPPAQKLMSMPDSRSLRRASEARRQGPMAMAPRMVPARLKSGTRLAINEKKPDARVASTQ
jgi:hypothetical protein